MYQVLSDEPLLYPSFSYFFWRWWGKSIAWGLLMGMFAGTLVLPWITLLAILLGKPQNVSFGDIVGFAFTGGRIGGIVGLIVGCVLGLITGLLVWAIKPTNQQNLMYGLSLMVIMFLAVIYLIWVQLQTIRDWHELLIGLGFFIPVLGSMLYACHRLSKWLFSVTHRQVSTSYRQIYDSDVDAYPPLMNPQALEKTRES